MEFSKNSLIYKHIYFNNLSIRNYQTIVTIYNVDKIELKIILGSILVTIYTCITAGYLK